jgi:hypothetical protein
MKKIYYFLLALLSTTPLKCKLDFMHFGRALFMDFYLVTKVMMTGNPLYPTPPNLYAAMDALVLAMYAAVGAKNFVLAEEKLTEIKNMMRENATYVQGLCLNVLSNLVSSGYKEAHQGGGASVVVGQVLNLVLSKSETTETSIHAHFAVPKGSYSVSGEIRVKAVAGGPVNPFVFFDISETSEMEFTGLTHGVDYEIRLRGKGVLGYGLYSSIEEFLAD